MCFATGGANTSATALRGRAGPPPRTSRVARAGQPREGTRMPTSASSPGPRCAPATRRCLRWPAPRPHRRRRRAAGRPAGPGAALVLPGPDPSVTMNSANIDLNAPGADPAGAAGAPPRCRSSPAGATTKPVDHQQVEPGQHDGRAGDLRQGGGQSQLGQGAGDKSDFHLRHTYYIRLMPPEVARAQSR